MRNHVVRIAVLHLCTIAALYNVRAQEPGGSIGGRVVDQAGNAVVGCRVLYQRRPRFASMIDQVSGTVRYVPAGPLSRGSVATAGDGTFTIAGLASGDYILCVDAPQGFLNPCEWATPTQVSVRPGEQKFR